MLSKKTNVEPELTPVEQIIESLNAALVAQTLESGQEAVPYHVSLDYVHPEAWWNMLQILAEAQGHPDFEIIVRYKNFKVGIQQTEA